jgi:hypothetical protein
MIISNTFPDLLDNSLGADLIDLTCLDSKEPTIAIVLICTVSTQSGGCDTIAWSRKGSSDSAMDIGIVGEQA